MKSSTSFRCFSNFDEETKLEEKRTESGEPARPIRSNLIVRGGAAGRGPERIEVVEAAIVSREAWDLKPEPWARAPSRQASKETGEGVLTLSGFVGVLETGVGVLALSGFVGVLESISLKGLSDWARQILRLIGE